MANDVESTRPTSAIPGFAILGCFATGIYGIVHAARTEDGSGLIAAAIAFGIVVHVTFR